MGFRARRRVVSRKVVRGVVPIEELETRALLSATVGGTGLLAQYFDTPDLTGQTLARVDSSVSFDWGAGSPDSLIANDTFSVRWSGQVEAEFTEAYDFIVNADADDGARLWVNGQLLVDAFDASGVSDAVGTIDLIAGRRYDIQFEYREGIGDAATSLEWISPSQVREVVPVERLHPATRGSLSVDVFSVITGSDVADLTSHANYPGSPTSGAVIDSFEVVADSADDFGQRIRGLVHPPVTGSYRFFIAADESAELWLSNSADSTGAERIAQVDSAVAARDWDAAAGQRSAVIFLVAGQSYYIEALHKEASGSDHLAVGWQLPGQGDVEVIAGEYLSASRPTVKIYSETPNVSEGSLSPAKFTIVRDGASLVEPLTVSYATRGDAVNGTDYAALPGTITIPAGARSVTLELLPVADNAVEGDETAVVELVSGQAYEVGLQSERTAYGNIQDDVEVPAGGESLWTGSELSDFSHFGGTFTTETDSIGQVIQAAIPTKPGNVFGAQLRQAIDAPVTEGDILFVEFLVKSIGGPGEMSAIFERASSPFTKSLSQGIPVGTDWARIQIPFYAAETYAIGEASFGFHLGHQVQTLRFAEFQVLSYGPPRSLAPETNLRLNNINGTWGTAQTVAVSGQSFSTAYEVETVTVPAQVWHLQAVERNEVGVASGDVMRVEFFARSTAGSAPTASLTMQRTDTFGSLFNQQIDLSAGWQFFTYDITSTDNFGSDGLQFVFNVGHGLQTVQIGGLTWENLSNTANIEDLPRQFPAASYLGRGATDVWREEADDRIESERKGGVRVTVTDASGNPLSGAVVNLRQNAHSFKFGSAINAYNGKLDAGGTEQALKYQAEIKRLFNTVVMENSHKWPGMLQDRQRALDAADFAVDNDLYLRGHNAIWPSREFMPSAVWDEYDSRKSSDGETSANVWLKDQIAARIADVVNTFESQVAEWDVVNEPFTNKDVMDIFGDDIVVEWYQQVRDADPNVQLALNDFGIFGSNGGNTSHRDNFDYWLGKLNDAGLLDIIGEQSHYSDATLTDITVLGDLVTSYNTQFDAPIAITEFDVNTTDEQLQADYLRDYMTMAFSQPAVEEFLHWGFWQSSHWLPDAALYRSDFSIKPNGQAYEDLVFGSWWSDVRGTTRDGSVVTDVFVGEYDVVVQYAGQQYLASVSVDDSGNSAVTVELPISSGLVVETADAIIGEGDGAAATTLTVTRMGDASSDLVVTLANDDWTELVVPETVTIFAGQSSATVDVDAVDDSLADGTQTVTVRASAAGFVDGVVSVDVADDEAAGFSVIEASTFAREGGRTDTVKVVLDVQPAGDVLIDVQSANGAEMAADIEQLLFTPDNWNIKQVVTVSAVDDSVADGRQLTDLTISVNDAGSVDAFDGLADQVVSVVTIDNDSSVYMDYTSLIVNGTPENDDIALTELSGVLEVDLNGETFQFSTSEYVKVLVSTFAGDDVVVATTLTKPVFGRLSSGNDTFHGGAAADTVQGGSGADHVFGYDGDDYLSSGSGGDTVEAGAGDDRLRGGNGDDSIPAGDGNDSISGGGGSDLLFGGAGDDSIGGGSKGDTIEGGTGDDTVLGGAGRDVIDGGDGNDFVDGENANDTLVGGAGRDLLLGSGGKDSLSGGDGDDLLVVDTTSLARDDLFLVLDEWSSSRSYAQRLSNVRGDAGMSSDRLNSAFLVGAGRTDRAQTTFGDTVPNKVAGGGGDDVFFAALADLLSDRLDTEWLELL